MPTPTTPAGATPAAKIVPVLGLYAPFARAKLEKLAKRAARYGQTISWTESPRTETVKIVTPYGKTIERVVERVDFAVVGEAPRVGDYRFLAALEATEGGVLVSSIGGVEIGAQGYDWAGGCEHCGSNRRRAYGYVVEGPDGRKVVGKSCLRDYVGTDVPAGAISLFTSLREFGGDEDGESWGSSGRWAETIEGVIATTRAAIALWGWRPSSQEGRTTAFYVNLAYGPVERDKQGREYNGEDRRKLNEELRARGEAYAAEAEAVIAWGRDLAARGDYEHNLKVALAGTYVGGKTFNLVVSACAAYDRQVAVEEKKAAERAAKADLPASEWVGTVGAKVEREALVEVVIGLPDYGYGPSQLYKFRCDDGAILTWKTSSYPEDAAGPYRQGDRVRVAGTVKQQGEYREVRETNLTRAKLARVAAQPVEQAA